MMIQKKTQRIIKKLSPNRLQNYYSNSITTYYQYKFIVIHFAFHEFSFGFEKYKSISLLYMFPCFTQKTINKEGKQSHSSSYSTKRILQYRYVLVSIKNFSDSFLKVSLWLVIIIKWCWYRYYTCRILVCPYKIEKWCQLENHK